MFKAEDLRGKKGTGKGTGLIPHSGSSPCHTDLIGVVRDASPALNRVVSIPDISTLARSSFQRNVMVVCDEKLLAGSALLSTFLKPKGSPVHAEAGAELDAKVGVGDLNPRGAGRIDELLSRRVVTGGTVFESVAL